MLKKLMRLSREAKTKLGLVFAVLFVMVLAGV